MGRMQGLGQRRQSDEEERQPEEDPRCGENLERGLETEHQVPYRACSQKDTT